MAGFKHPIADQICRPVEIDSGTMCRQPSPLPATLGICQLPQSNPMLTDQNVADLARIIMSEASIGNITEQTAVGSAVINRMTRNSTSRVASVEGAFASNQIPTLPVVTLARELLIGLIKDNTSGSTHFYSPRSMPIYKEGVPPPHGFDVGGGVETVPGVGHANYRPSWVKTFIFQPIEGVRDAYYKFYRPPGHAPVR